MRPSGFTLIELLVCISIISILISLFLPCAQKINNYYRDIQCQATLRQIGIASSAYSIDNNQFTIHGEDYSFIGYPSTGFNESYYPTEKINNWWFSGVQKGNICNIGSLVYCNYLKEDARSFCCLQSNYRIERTYTTVLTHSEIQLDEYFKKFPIGSQLYWSNQLVLDSPYDNWSASTYWNRGPLMKVELQSSRTAIEVDDNLIHLNGQNLLYIDGSIFMNSSVYTDFNGNVLFSGAFDRDCR